MYVHCPRQSALEVVSATVDRHSSALSDVGSDLSFLTFSHLGHSPHSRRSFLTDEDTADHVFLCYPFPGQEDGLVREAFCSHSCLVPLACTCYELKVIVVTPKQQGPIF